MRFKENLQKKIRIDRLARAVIDAMGPPGSGRKIDKTAMTSLLDMSPYEYRRERDLDLYIREIGEDAPRILVLDNELPIYRTTAADVVLRKSPTVREMVNISNVVKILSDKDVKESKKEDSVKTVQDACLEGLDLSFSPADIQGIAADGRTALEAGDPDGVEETLALFSELLGWTRLSDALPIGGQHIVGRKEEVRPGETLYGPMVLYDPRRNVLRLVKGPIGGLDKPALDGLQRMAAGKEKADLEGPDVLDDLSDAVLQSES
jgi:hypothetical protein